MKICHTTEFFFPNEGGVERHIYYLAKELFAKKKAYDISVIASDREHDGRVIRPLQINFEGIKVYREKSIVQKHFWNYFPSMKKTLKQIAPDIVHAHAYRHPHVGMSVDYAIKNKKKCVFTPYTIFLHSAELPKKNKIFYPLYDIFGYKIFNKVDSIIALTHFEKNELIKKGVDKNKISVIPCGGYSFQPIKDSKRPEPDITKILEEHNGKFIIGALSRIHPSKGIDVLLRALALIKDEDWFFIFGGTDYGCLQELLNLAEDLGISNKIKYLGFINKQKKQFYDGLDLFVSPSKAEALGMTLVEAQALGKPVIGSNFGPIRETLLHNVTGYLVDYGDHATMAARIKELMHSSTLRKEFSKKAKLRAGYFSWENIANCIEKVYNGEQVDLYSKIKL